LASTMPHTIRLTSSILIWEECRVCFETLALELSLMSLQAGTQTA
jgi:hypothetical protein